MRKIITLALAVFIGIQISPALAEGWVKSENLKCGVAEVFMKSTCTTQIDGEPPHCNQELTFNSTGRPVKKISYSPIRAAKGDEPFVSRLACRDVRGTKYVMTQSTNFGNCADCEWVDVFEANGRYLGSTPSISWALDFPRRRLGRGFSSLLRRRSDEGVDISRVR